MVYLVCFNDKYHYVGFSESKVDELDLHKIGIASRLFKTLNKANIEYKITKTWNADRNFERFLKRSKDITKHCPHCSKEGEGHVRAS